MANWVTLRNGVHIDLDDPNNPISGKGNFSSFFKGKETTKEKTAKSSKGFDKDRVKIALNAQNQPGVSIVSNSSSSFKYDDKVKPIVDTNGKLTETQLKDADAVIEDRMSNKVKPFKKEDKVDMSKVKSRGNLTDSEAKETVSLAEAVYSKAAKVEPQITKDVLSAVEGVGASMYGLDYRLKQPTSMAGKIGGDAKDEQAKGKTFSFKDAADDIKDAVRYTTVIDENNFTNGYNKIKASMEAKGYKEVRCKNYYELYETGDSCQKAVQCSYQNKDGYTFELQFHTIRSLGIKENYNHKLYEISREKTTPKTESEKLNAIMTSFGTYVNNPKDVFTIKSHK